MRPFIEFVQQQLLPWEPGVLPSTRQRVLSRDDESGAQSLIVDVPAGWFQGARTLGASEEFLVLAGSVTADGVAYERLCYGRLPAGTTISGDSSTRGAVVALFHDRDPTSEPPAEPDTRKRVDKIDLRRSCEPTGPRNPDHPNPSSVKRFPLFDDPDTGESTWVFSGQGMGHYRRPEKHPVVEEMLHLAGELHGPNGVMRSGAYFWRPPEEWHGPFGFVGGCVLLFRTQGGPLTTIYADDDAQFEWDAPYAPILPGGCTIPSYQYDELAMWRASSLVGTHP